MGVINIVSKDAYVNIVNEAKTAKKKLILKFSAAWCGPCKVIKPEFDKLSEEHPEIIFATLDVDEIPDVAAECEVTAMPTFVVIVDGKVQEDLTVIGADRLKLMNLVE